LENYCYSVKNSCNDEKLKDKFEGEDRTVAIEKSEEIIKWLEGN